MNVASVNPKSSADATASRAERNGSDLERRRALGQFFTSPEVATFMWDLLGIINGRRFPAATRMVDPACGEGVFLQTAHARGGLDTKSIFGADIDETLLPIWRGDPLLRRATVTLGNGLLDDPTAGITEGIFDLVVGNPPFSGKGLQDLLRLLEMEKSESRHIEQDLFETSCPKEESTSSSVGPLSRKERAEFDRLVRVLSQYSCWRLEAEPDTEPVEEIGSQPNELFETIALHDRRRLTASDYERTAHLIAHWPPNRPLDVSRAEIRDVIRRLASTAIEVVFTERFVRLAKPGGLIALIVPESIVASDRLGAFRLWLLGRMDLLASISLPQKVFTGVGANARTSIIFARRLEQDRVKGWCSHAVMPKIPDDDRPVFMAAPQTKSPGFSNQIYFNRLLASARRQRQKFWPSEQEMRA